MAKNARSRVILEPSVVGPKVNDAFEAIGRMGDLNTLDPRNYREGYWALCDLFNRYVSLDDAITIRAGATAAYGWMPRIIRSVQMGCVESHLETLKALRAARSAPDAVSIIGRLSEADREDILHFVDGSLVGTSKFLHFLNPVAVPVWDRRVARNFGIPVWRIDTVPDYLEFWRGLSIGQFNNPPTNLVRFCATGSHQASDLRLREYALFLLGR